MNAGRKTTPTTRHLHRQLAHPGEAPTWNRPPTQTSTSMDPRTGSPSPNRSSAANCARTLPQAWTTGRRHRSRWGLCCAARVAPPMRPTGHSGRVDTLDLRSGTETPMAERPAKGHGRRRRPVRRRSDVHDRHVRTSSGPRAARRRRPAGGWTRRGSRCPWPSCPRRPGRESADPSRFRSHPARGSVVAGSAICATPRHPISAAPGDPPHRGKRKPSHWQNPGLRNLSLAPPELPA